MHRALTETAHRPWPLPAGPWIMSQSWHDLLFAHWPIDASTSAPADSRAHSKSTNFKAKPGSASSHSACPEFACAPRRRCPTLSAFPELNVRTYVTHGGKPGVWFFSLDAANAIAVSVARAWFHLPYFNARMRCENRNGWIEYTSERTHRNARESKTAACAIAQPEKSSAPQPGTLEHFLTERYCLYAADAKGQISRGEIQHAPWPLQQAQAEFRENTMIEAALECGTSAPPLTNDPRHPNDPLLALRPPPRRSRLAPAPNLSQFKLSSW